MNHNLLEEQRRGNLTTSISNTLELQRRIERRILLASLRKHYGCSAGVCGQKSRRVPCRACETIIAGGRCPFLYEK